MSIKRQIELNSSETHHGCPMCFGRGWYPSVTPGQPAGAWVICRGK